MNEDFWLAPFPWTLANETEILRPSEHGIPHYVWKNREMAEAYLNASHDFDEDGGKSFREWAARHKAVPYPFVGRG